MNNQMKKITIADVAEALGVSKTTVSRAISGKGRIGEETRNRVLEYIEANDYQPNVIAKSLAQSKTYNVALLMPSDYNLSTLPFFQNCMYGVSEAASKRDYDVLMVYSVSGQVENLRRVINNNKIDGVLLTRTLLHDDVADFVKERGIPAVAIGSMEDEELVQVDHDHRAACCQLTASLLEQGFQKIALIGGNEEYIVTRRRYQGFCEAFAQKGKKVCEDYIFLNAEDPQGVAEKVELLLKKEPDCIVCMDDMICYYVLEKLQKEQIKVPQQMKVASFYGSMVIESYVPHITTLEFDAREAGGVACNTLIDIIEGKEVKHKTLLPYKVKNEF